ncbi:MAG: hypothetical protein AB1796_14100 [Bacillota bacterium]
MSKNSRVRTRQKGRTTRWAIIAGIWTFFLALIFALVMRFLLHTIQSIILSFAILLIIIFIGIVFDMVGMAVTAAEEKPFHAKAAKKISGAKQAIYLVRNADKVSSFCNDVIGDISGVASGVAGTVIIINLVMVKPGLSELYLSIFLTAIISALTVGGKAVGKAMAINRPTDVVFFIAQFLTGLERLTLGKKRVRTK